MKVLSDAQVASYQHEGYAFPFVAMSADEASEHRRRLEDWEQRNPTEFPIWQLLRSKAHLMSTDLFDLVHSERILDAVEDVLGPNILCWASGVFLKEANDPSYVAWHQDGMYWGLDKPEIVTAWLALTDATIENGAMRVIPRTHTGSMMRHADLGREGNMLARGQEIAVEVNEGEAVDLVLRAGQFSLHHVKLAHGSKPNQSGDRRIGFAIRYVAPAVKQVGATRGSVILVRGQDNFGHFERDEEPKQDFDAAAIDAMRKAHARNQADTGATAR